MHIPEIIQVKDRLDELKSSGIIAEWELPYENILTRRSAAIFFLTPAGEDKMKGVESELDKFENFSYRLNTEKNLSQLQYRVTFSKEEREKNLSAEAVAKEH
jgi:hypothetical protein